MALKAMGFLRIQNWCRVASPCVFERRYTLKMMWVAALGIFTKMVNYHTVWDFINMEHVGKPMSANICCPEVFSIYIHGAVPTRCTTTNPIPASSDDIYLDVVKEKIHQSRRVFSDILQGSCPIGFSF